MKGDRLGPLKGRMKDLAPSRPTSKPFKFYFLFSSFSPDALATEPSQVTTRKHHPPHHSTSKP